MTVLLPFPASVDSEKNHSVTSAPEAEMECGQELKEEGGPKVTSAPQAEMECGQELKEDGSSFLSSGSSDRQENADEPCSDASWTVQRVSVPGPGRAGLEGAILPVSHVLSLCREGVFCCGFLSG